MQRAENDQPARNVAGARSEAVDARLQMRRELGELLSAEVLKLVEGHDVSRLAHRFDGSREGEQAVRATEVRRNAEGIHGVVDGRKHAGRRRIRDLNVKRLLATGIRERALNEGGLADPPPPGHARKEPAPALKHGVKLGQLIGASIESPGHR